MTSRLRDDSGSAVVEFVFLSIVLMIPLVYLVMALASLQSAAFAAEAVARDVSRAAVVGGVEALQDGESYSAAEIAARERAEAVLTMTSADFDIAADAVDVALECSASPCLAPGTDMNVAVTISVSLPGLGGLGDAARVTVSSQGSSPVDGYLP